MMNNFTIPDWDRNQVGDAVSKEFASVGKIKNPKKGGKKAPTGKKQTAKANANKKISQSSKSITKIKKEASKSPKKLKQEVNMKPVMKKAVVVLKRQSGIGNKAKNARKRAQKKMSTSPLMKEALVVLRRQNDLESSSAPPVSPRKVAALENLDGYTIINKPKSPKASPKTPKKEPLKNGPKKRRAVKQTPKQESPLMKSPRKPSPANKVIPAKKSDKNIKRPIAKEIKPTPAITKKKTVQTQSVSTAKGEKNQRKIKQLNPASTAIKKATLNKKAKKTIKLKVAGLLANKNTRVQRKQENSDVMGIESQVNGTSQRPSRKGKNENMKTPSKPASPTKSPTKKTITKNLKGTANKTIKKPARDNQNMREKITKFVETEMSPAKKGKKPAKESLNVRMVTQLQSARFRYINEELYTKSSRDAVKMFKDDPDAFAAYHEGYRKQVGKWPMNPLTKIINSLRKMPPDTIIADFGCGDAVLSKSIKQTVHSFDLVAANEHVVACDMSKVPLAKESIDVAVFCLSLMGTNLEDFMLEANRVLKLGGILKIVEIASRFDNVATFISGVTRFGFMNKSKNFDHKLFHYMDFEKVRFVKNKKNLPTMSLLPCLYKRR